MKNWNVIKKNIMLPLMLAAATAMQAQGTMADVLAMIERNNSTLAAAQKQAEADKIGNKTGIYLDAPEIGYNYLLGSPGDIGKRHDISVSQSFDLATLSGKRNRVADGQNALVDCAVRSERMGILLEAKLLLVDVVYYNNALRQLDERYKDALELKENGKRMLDAGECSLMDYNNVQLSCQAMEADMLKMKADRQQALLELARLNGGVPVSFESVDYGDASLERDFSAWYNGVASRLPEIVYAMSDIKMSQRQLSLAKSEGLPSVSLGYMSEKTKAEHFQGVSLGVSVPLWSNKNRVRHARASVMAAEARKDDKEVQLRSQLQMLHARVLSLGQVADVCSKAADQYDRSLLQRALDAGEISKIDFFLQSAAYYDMVDKAMAAAHEYQTALAQLTAADL